MTQADDYPAAVARELAARGSGFLRNVIREEGVTCDVCGTPVNVGWRDCRPCQLRRSMVGIADLVAPLAYCIEGEQSYEVFRGYKDSRYPAVRERHMEVIERMLFLAFISHRRCIVRRIGQNIDHYMAVPSLRGRTGIHPFAQLMAYAGLTQHSPQLAAAPGPKSDDRITSANQFVLSTDVDFSGKHVLIIDDTWTTGSHTQSAALTLRKHRASYVSVMTMARYLRPSFANNAAFIKNRLNGRDYDPNICPVTGGNCP